MSRRSVVVVVLLGLIVTSFAPDLARAQVPGPVPTPPELLPTPTPTPDPETTPQPSPTPSASPQPEPVQSGERTEEVDLRTKYSKTFLEDDGSHTAEIYTSPVHYQRTDGSWDEIDTTLVPCDSTACGWRNNKGSFSVEFADVAASSEMVTIDDGAHGLSFGALQANSAQEAIVDRNEITYKDVQPGVDLRYEVGPDRVKELIILEQPSDSSVSLTFPLELDSVTPGEAADGSIELTDLQGAVRFTLPPLWMEDTALVGEEAARTNLVSMEVQETASGYAVVVTPDQAWLSDPARHYPVRIDPVVTIGTSSSDDAMDTWVQDNSSGPHGSDTLLKVGGNSSAGGTSRADTLIRFPLSSIPNNARVRNAWMTIEEDQTSTSLGCSGWQIDVHQITSTWDEQTSWGAEPNIGPALSRTSFGSNSPCPPWTFQAGDSSQNDPDNCDDAVTRTGIGDVVDKYVTGAATNYGFMLRGNPLTNTYWRKFRSAEVGTLANRPRLTVNYTNAPGVPTGLTAQPTQTAQGYNNFRQPKLNATYQDQDSNDNGTPDSGCVKYQIYRTNGTGNQAGHGSFVAPGNQSPWTVPLNLDPNTQYLWKARGFDEWADGPWTGEQTFNVPPAPPGPPTITSTSHPLQSTWSQSNDPSFQWVAVLNASDYAVRLQKDSCESIPTEGKTGGGLTKAYTDKGDGKWCFSAASIDSNNQISSTSSTYWVWIDTSPPSTITPTCPSSPTSDNTPTFSFSSSDTQSGIDRYEYQWDQLAGHQVAPKTQITSSSATMSSTGEGTWYFTVEAFNKAGASSGVASCPALLIDAVVSAPTISSSTHPTQNTEYDSDDPQFSWTAPTNAESGLSGFEYWLDSGTHTTVPASTLSASYTNVSSGTHVFHVRANANSGAFGEGTYTFIVKDNGPSSPGVTCDPPLSATSWSNATTGSFRWTPPSGTVSGYSYEIAASASPPSTVPDNTSEGTATSISNYSLGSSQGSLWFFVKARNGNNVWGTRDSCSFKIDRTNPDQPPKVVSTTHAPGVVFNNGKVRMDWLSASDHDPGSPTSCSANAGCSGLMEYQYKFSSSTDEPAGFWSGAETTQPGTTAIEKDLGQPTPTPVTYYFHLRARDQAGNASPSVFYGPIKIGSDGLLTPLAPTLDNLNELFSAQSDEMGLEQFYAYKNVDLGTAQGFINLKTGNLVVQDDDLVIPGIGLNTVVRHTYNSQRDDSYFHETGIGRGWSISVADAAAEPSPLNAASVGIDVNAPISFAQVVSRDASNVVTADDRLFEFTDGDGTAHRFVKDALAASPHWVSPPGVDLKLTEAGSDFELTRPDGVKYVITHQTITDPEPAQQPAAAITPLVLSEIRDRNGNTLTFAYEYRPLATGVGGVRVRSVFHNSGREVAHFSYNTAGDLLRIEGPPSSGQLTDPNRRNSFFITNDRLTKVIDSDGTADARSNNYEYVTLDKGALQSVDMLTAVQDGIGAGPQGSGHKTQFCVTPAQPATCFAREGEDLRIKDIVDRESKTWTLTYSETTLNGQPVRQTVWKDPLFHATTYLITLRDRVAPNDKRLTGGNIRRITDAGANAGPIVTNYFWTENKLSSRNDAFGSTTYRYNSLGQLLVMTSPPVNDVSRTTLPDGDPRKLSAGMADPIKTRLSYDYKSTAQGCTEPTDDPNYAISTQGSCASIGELVESIAGEGSSDPRRTEFAYDSRGNLSDIWRRALTSGSDPADRHTHMDYAPTNGLLSTVDGPRDASDPGMGGVNDVTSYGYGTGHTGQPTTITDAFGHAQVLTYNAYGQALSHLDREARLDRFQYDERGNLRSVIDPDGDESAITWDLNDNLASVTTPRGVATTSPADDFQTTYAYDGNEHPLEIKSPGVDYSATKTKVTMAYRSDGLLSSRSRPYQDPSLRADTTYSYYVNGLPLSMSVPTGTGLIAQSSYNYDLAGRLAQVTSPVVDDAGTRPVTNYSYSPAGTVTKQTETSSTGGTRVWEMAYDPHGGTVETLLPRQDGRTDTEFNKFGEVKKVHRYLSATNKLTTTYGFDSAGNTVSVDQPGPNNGTLQSTFQFDPLNRLKVQTRPGEASTTFAYDDDGLQISRIQGARTLTTVYNPDRSVQSSIATQSNL